MSLPFFNMYPRDFEADTSHLSLEEDGAYNRLLRLCWMAPGCSLPDDDAWIMRRMRVDQETFERVVKVVLDEFFVRREGRVSNARMTREFERGTEAHKRRVEAGSKGGKNKALKNNEKAPSNATAKPKQPKPEPEPDIEDTNVSSSAKKKRRKSCIPEDAVISDAMLRAAEKRDLSLQEAEAQFQKFKNDALAKGKTFVDWDRAFVTWLDSPYFRPALTAIQGGRHGNGTDGRSQSPGGTGRDTGTFDAVAIAARLD